MSCINPLDLQIRIKGRFKNINVSCGHCLNCLIKKQSQLTFLANKELLTRYSKGQGASFVTLTYDDNHIPYNENGFVTLRKSDVQKFLKNVRRQIEYHNMKKDFKVIYCGEYGDGSHSTSSTGVSTCRPHYHIAFLGLTDSEAKFFTRKLWKHGLCDIGPLSAGGIRYICKYLTKACPDKEIKELREIAGVESPFINHSIGLGKEWIDKHLEEIVENDFHFNLNGKRTLFPRYVLRYVSAHTGVDYLSYVNKEIYNDRNREIARKNGFKSLDGYLYEQSFIKYKYKVASLRSQGKPITDITLNKKWIRPKHSFDRIPSVSVLAEAAYNSVDHSSPFTRKKLEIPRKKVFNTKTLTFDNVVDWDRYLYGDVVPF